MIYGIRYKDVQQNCVFTFVISTKGNSKNITSLTVGKTKYKGVRVKDGFFNSLSALKNPPHTPSYGDYDLDYKIILWLASSQPIPLIPIHTT